MKIKHLAVVSLLLVLSLSIALAAEVVSIWGGARGTIILKSDGTVWTWGSGGFGKLGNNTTTGRSLVPVEVHGPGNIDYLHSVTAIMGGESHNMALKSDGTLWGWGMNGAGQMGNGTSGANVLTPVMVSNSLPGQAVNNPLQVSCGY